MPNILLFNKPFQVLTQFTTEDDKKTLADFIDRPNFYAAGRLDYDSEGLLILTDNGALQHQFANPKFKLEKTYWAQVEGEITDEALAQLRTGVTLKDGQTKPASAQQINPPSIWDRTPPIRERKNIPTSWVELKITEGKNRQVRRMTAAVGFPTLRLIRYAIGSHTLESLLPGELREVSVDAPAASTENTKTNRTRKRTTSSRHPKQTKSSHPRKHPTTKHQTKKAPR